MPWPLRCFLAGRVTLTEQTPPLLVEWGQPKTPPAQTLHGTALYAAPLTRSPTDRVWVGPLLASSHRPRLAALPSAFASPGETMPGCLQRPLKGNENECERPGFVVAKSLK